MTTYGQFYNPKEPDNRKAIALLAMAAFILLAWIFGGILSGCNSVKKSTDTHISKTDSSTSAKIDSLATEKRDFKVDSSGVKQWERETVIEYYPDGFYRQDSGFTGQIYRPTEYQDGKVKIKAGLIKKLTIRTKGKDSAAVKVVDLGEKKTDLTKEQGTELSKFDKSKTSQKETSRSSPVIWIVLGFVAIIVAGIFILKRFR